MNKSPDKYKPFCEECRTCDFYKNFLQKDACVWGANPIYLISADNPKKCSLKNQNPPENSTLFDLNKLEKAIVQTHNLEHQKLFINRNEEIKLK